MLFLAQTLLTLTGGPQLCRSSGEFRLWTSGVWNQGVRKSEMLAKRNNYCSNSDILTSELWTRSIYINMICTAWSDSLVVSGVKRTHFSRLPICECIGFGQVTLETHQWQHEPTSHLPLWLFFWFQNVTKLFRFPFPVLVRSCSLEHTGKLAVFSA